MIWMRPLLLLALLVFPPFPALAWGPEGHAIVADIAEEHLTPVALRRVTEILHGQRMRDVASYADQVRPVHREQTRWHFINFEPGTVDYQPERDCKNIEGQGDCIIAAIARSIEDLTSSGEPRELGLKYLIHFVGDVHQPFHAIGEAFGGNQIKVTFLGSPSNLHKVWDTDMIRYAGIPPSEYARRLEQDWISGRDMAMLGAGTPVQWALESRSLGQKAMVTNNSDLGDVYARAFVPVMDERLALAGLRLAAILNAQFK